MFDAAFLETCADPGVAGATRFPVGSVLTCSTPARTSGWGPLFGKVLCVVAHARGSDDSSVLRDAIKAWRTGQFEGDYVFAQPGPGPLNFYRKI